MKVTILSKENCRHKAQLLHNFSEAMDSCGMELKWDEKVCKEEFPAIIINGYDPRPSHLVNNMIATVDMIRFALIK